MKKIIFAAIGVLLTLPFSLPANAFTCAEQAQICARLARERGAAVFTKMSRFSPDRRVPENLRLDRHGRQSIPG
jgi:hypothetical protein